MTISTKHGVLCHYKGNCARDEIASLARNGKKGSIKKTDSGSLHLQRESLSFINGNAVASAQELIGQTGILQMRSLHTTDQSD